MSDTIEIMAEEFKVGYPLTYDAIYNKGRADQKEEDNAFFNFEGAWELEKKKIRADAIDEMSSKLKLEFSKMAIDDLAVLDILNTVSRIANELTKELKSK